MNRVDRLREAFDDGEAALITGRAGIFYYSGFTSEDAVLIITHDRAVLVTDSRYTVQAANQAPDFEIRNIREGYENIIGDMNIRFATYEDDKMTVAEYNNFIKYFPDMSAGSIKLSQLRAVKDKDEVSKIGQAQALGDAAFSHIVEYIKEGRTEREIALEIEFFMKRNGASGLSFETIVASGVRSCMPHGTATDKPVEKGDLLTLDFGCVLDGYCSDMTRTVAIGSCGDRQREIYNVVLNAQRKVLEKIHFGMKCSDADKIARDYISGMGYGDCFGHGLGHGVGIEIHEMPFLSSRSDYILRPGNIVTVEPGVYIDGFAGVRIEDLIKIGEDGIENLTHSDKELVII